MLCEPEKCQYIFAGSPHFAWKFKYQIIAKGDACALARYAENPLNIAPRIVGANDPARCNLAMEVGEIRSTRIKCLSLSGDIATRATTFLAETRQEFAVQIGKFAKHRDQHIRQTGYHKTLSQKGNAVLAL